MRDKFMNGFGAGLLADLPILLLDWLIKADNLDLMHYVSILAFEEPKPTGWGLLFATFFQMLFAGMMGVIFAFLLPKINTSYYYIKTALYGSMVWFTIYSIDIFFKIEGTVKIDFKTALTHYLLSLVWGLVMGWVLRGLVKGGEE